MDMKKHFIGSVCFIFLGLSVFAQSYIENGVPKDSSFTPNQAWQKVKDQYPDSRVVKAELPKNVKANYNLTYATIENTPYGKRDLHLDVFRPKTDQVYPVLLLIHGGGWASGNKSMETPMAMQMASHGYVCIPVEYRLTPEKKYPAAIHDIKAAIRWVRANSNEYGMDTSRIAIEGNSVGGMMAAFMGTTGDNKQFEGNVGGLTNSSKVHAVIDIDGMLDFLAPVHINQCLQKTDPIHPWLNVSFQKDPMVWRDASPNSWIDNNSAPILFINSGIFRFHAGQDEMIGMLNELGIYNEVHKFDINVHPFWLMHPWFDPTIKIMVNFLEKIFL